MFSQIFSSPSFFESDLSLRKRRNYNSKYDIRSLQSLKNPLKPFVSLPHQNPEGKELIDKQIRNASILDKNLMLKQSTTFRENDMILENKIPLHLDSNYIKPREKDIQFTDLRRINTPGETTLLSNDAYYNLQRTNHSTLNPSVSGSKTYSNIEREREINIYFSELERAQILFQSGDVQNARRVEQENNKRLIKTDPQLAQILLFNPSTQSRKNIERLLNNRLSRGKFKPHEIEEMKAIDKLYENERASLLASMKAKEDDLAISAKIKNLEIIKKLSVDDIFKKDEAHDTLAEYRKNKDQINKTAESPEVIDNITNIVSDFLGSEKTLATGDKERRSSLEKQSIMEEAEQLLEPNNFTQGFVEENLGQGNSIKSIALSLLNQLARKDGGRRAIIEFYNNKDIEIPLPLLKENRNYVEYEKLKLLTEARRTMKEKQFHRFYKDIISSSTIGELNKKIKGFNL